MSQRNPMNERYSENTERTGSSRKSASSAKPKSKAAASVTIASTAKSPKEKKAAQRAAQKKAADKERATNQKYYAPPTQRYKTLRRTWWVLLGTAIAATVLSWLLQANFPVASVIALVTAYAAIIGALYVDLGPTRKERKRYAAAVQDKSTPEHAAWVAANRAEKAAEKETKKQAKEAYDASKEEPKKGLLSGLFGKKEAAGAKIEAAAEAVAAATAPAVAEPAPASAEQKAE